MRLAVLAALALAGSLYAAAAYRAFEEETAARGPAAASRLDAHRHPEANLRVLREAFAAGTFSDDLATILNRTLDEAPTFYQPPFLLATFHANRIDDPARTRRGFEAALERFPSNGRLHLSFAQWLLSPKPTAPYRLNRETAEQERAERRDLALAHVETATRLEPELTSEALRLMLRAGLPASGWSNRLPRTDATRRLLLEAIDRSPRDRGIREALLREFLSEPAELELDRSLDYYAARWGFPELALAASERWRKNALASGASKEIRLATVALVGRHLERDDADGAYEVLRQTLAEMEERGLPRDESVELLVAAGDVYVNARRNLVAQGLYTEAVTLSPHHGPARLGLARVYREAGDLEGARLELRRVLEREPANAQARALLEALEK